MCACHRRRFVVLAGCALAGLLPRSAASALGDDEKRFVAEALRMRSEAVASGDQPFGAVIVRYGAIVGYGPSRVIVDRDPDAHAERVALRDAQRRLGSADMSGAIMYSTSRPCAACESALAQANVERMVFGAAATDAGRPARR